MRFFGKVDATFPSRNGQLAGNRLIFSNKREEDIILRDEFEAMAGLDRLFTLTDEPAPGLLHERVDAAFLQRHVGDFSQRFYLCGPDAMVKDLRHALAGLGAAADSVTFEK